MIHITENMTLITPCFCAGANPNVAELRASAIRGQLRWWFRVLGGTSELEKEIFGGVHEGAKASKIVVRVKNENKLVGEPSELPQQNGRLYYLFHFANASGKQRGDKYGPRYAKYAWLKEGSTFTIEVLSRLPVRPEEESQFLRAWNAFINLGALGLRQTRGLGAFASEKLLDFNQLKQALHDLGRFGINCWYVAEMNGRPAFRNSWRDSMMFLEAALGHVRQHGFKSKNPTPLGNSGPRQASALHLRPVRLKEGYIPLLYYTPQTLTPQNARSHTQLLELLNGNIPCKVPYKQKPENPDGRDECRIITL